ncbi:hypothetical protein JOQ06_010147 [Pogonophryne albipinna]|uniref:Uncharacterized protein n=1 Tax=Pogonophryne albipinna TaxID=1090488 RepID=A0AAD6FFA8_9TELE|nr:hypothetical protein JOQ06_010147 [Pogonophryne albipinna]
MSRGRAQMKEDSGLDRHKKYTALTNDVTTIDVQVFKRAKRVAVSEEGEREDETVEEVKEAEGEESEEELMEEDEEQDEEDEEDEEEEDCAEASQPLTDSPLKSFRERKGDFNYLKQWWDCGKADIKQLCLQYTLNVSRDITKSMRDLEMEIVELQSFAESTGNPGCIEDLKSKKAILADLLGSRAQGVLVRSRFQSASMMDSPTKYFFSLEKKNGQGRLIHALRSAGGQQLTGNSQIRQRAVDFYCDLFTSEYTADDGGFNLFCRDLPTVSEETNKELDGPLTEEELCAALKSMQGGRPLE